MSILTPILNTVQFPFGETTAIIIRPYRALGAILANVTVAEMHNDEVVTTEHPVEQGAAISDHMYKKPAELTLQLGWSNSGLNALGNPTYVRNVYTQLLTLQASFTLSTIYTGKRKYTNMAIVGIQTHTDVETENALFATIRCKQFLYVTTQSVTVGGQQAPASNQASPQNTAAPVNLGQQQPTIVATPLAPLSDAYGNAGRGQ